MRFGRWAAAAAAMVLAGATGTANATDYIVYQVNGTGSLTVSNSAGAVLRYDPMTGFTATFSVLAAPGYYFNPGNVETSDGFVFNHSASAYSNVIDASTSGKLTGQRVNNNPFGGHAELSLNYADTDLAGGFPTSFASPSATGTFNDVETNQSGQFYNFSGTVSTIYRIGNSQFFTGLGTSSYNALPEPATWGLMLLGVGMLGTVMRRQRATRMRLASV